MGLALRLAVLALTGTTLVACSSTGDDKGCSYADCTSNTTMFGYATLQHDDMAKATIVACLKGGCSQGKPGTLPGTSNDRILVALSGAVTAQAYIYSSDAKGYKIEVDFSISDQSPKDGDPYELKVLTADGATHDDYQATAVYQTVTPNGPSCPPVCKTATIDKTL